MWTLLLSSALAFDNGAWQATLDRYVAANGAVDYAAVQADKPLDAWLVALGDATEPASRSDRMAFWINAYNALTLDLVADSYPIASIMDLDGGKVWDNRSFRVAGRQVTLNDIEQRILRPLADARVHAALNCASRGCPPLSKKAYAGPTIDAQLQEASRAWMASTGIQIDQAGRSVKLNRIFEWYGGDFYTGKHADIPGFDGKTEAALDYAIRYLPADQAAWLKKGGYTLGWIEYDWKLNGK